MNERVERRTELGLTQTEAARNAGVSLATWRRWEDEPEVVSEKTRASCENVLVRESELERRLSKSASAFLASWNDSQRLTPRQAYAIASELDGWADGELADWIRDPSAPLHEIAPFHHFDLRVMMFVGESKAWAESVRERCHAVSEEIEAGILPFDRRGCLLDEVLMAAALRDAPELLNEIPELFEHIPPRVAIDDEEDYSIGDEDWDIVSDGFDDICRWDEWEVPIYRSHPLLSKILAERHPFRWLDLDVPTGSGYLRELSGLAASE